MVHSRLYILPLFMACNSLVTSTFLSKMRRVVHHTKSNHMMLFNNENECLLEIRGGSSNHPQYDESDDEEMPNSPEFHEQKMGQYPNFGSNSERDPYLNEQERAPYVAEQNYQARKMENLNSYEQAPRHPDQRFPQQYPYDGRGEPNLPPPEGSFAPPPFPTNDFNEPPLPGKGQNYPQQIGRHYSNPQHPPPSQRNQRLQQPIDTVSNPSPELELESFDKDLIFNGLKRMYRKKILPLEISSKYGHFHSPPLSPSDFDAKPMVLLLGQYSVGKTSFIRYLLGRDFPGIRVGPEPTTDRFTCILHGDSDKVIPGAALCSQSDRPFRGLSPFGNNFLSKLEAVELDAPILRNITLVDTPGILSGTKQSIGRNYDYDAVMKWFAERADLIIVMFDAHKLDISDELKRVIELMGPHADKLRVVLNKADSISTQQLMRVYGALMWQLGKVMNTPEVCRVYIGSFWGSPLKNIEQAALFNKEKLDLFMDIAQLPQNAVMRRINELVKRARGVKVHAYIIHYLRKQLPYTFGKKEKQQRLIDRLDKEMIMCARRYELPRGDFPPVEPMRQALREIKDLSEFPKLDKRMVKEMDKVFSVDIPEMLERARGDR
jgi:GTPase SAR1 family protein